MKYKIEISEYKTITYYYKDKYHKEDDLPAIIDSNGHKYYYKNGKLHRDGDKPAIIHSNSDKKYWKNGVKIK
jgi:hypothetical protein